VPTAVVRTVEDLRAAVGAARRRGERVGVTPTMGAFHEGHLALMRHARAECGFVVTTLFVNPTQFAPHEDLSRYPRSFSDDLANASAVGIDLLFAPTAQAVYPQGYSTYVTVEGVTSGFEGALRPHHFRGVATVVTKLLNMVQPDRAYFGEKDYQQLQVIRRLVRDLDLPVEVVACPTVRERDGLAMSSRNRYLSDGDRAVAPVLYRSLLAAAECYRTGERSVERLLSVARGVIQGEPLLELDYLELADATELTPPPDPLRGPTVLLVAARLGRTRLLDNIVLGRDTADEAYE
jgi:pantoate--beta-alanine ligase